MVKPEKFDHLYLLYHFTVPLMDLITPTLHSSQLSHLSYIIYIYIYINILGIRSPLQWFF